MSALVSANNKVAPNVTPGMAGVNKTVAPGVLNNTEETPRIATLVGASNVSNTNMLTSTEVAPRIRNLVGASNKVAPGVSSSTREASRIAGMSKTVAPNRAPRTETLVGASSVVAPKKMVAPKKVVAPKKPLKAKETPVKNTSDNEAPREIDIAMQTDAFLYESDSNLESPEPITLLTPSPNKNGKAPEPNALNLPVYEDQGLSPTNLIMRRDPTVM